MVSSMWLHWLGETLSSSFTSRLRLSAAQGAQWDMAGQVTACLSLTQRGDSGQHCLLTHWGTLTFQRGPGGVSLQVILAQAGPCRSAELLQGWAAALAPQPGRAVAVLGDDGPKVASCGSEQSRARVAMGEQGRHESSPRGSGIWGRVGKWVAPTDGAARHAGQDPQGGRGVAGVLLTLPGLWPGPGTGIWSSRAGWRLWEGESRMQRAHGSSLCPCCSAPAQRLGVCPGVCSSQSTPFSRDAFCVLKIWSALDCPALHWPRHQRAPTNALATALTCDTAGPSRVRARGWPWAYTLSPACPG